MKSPTKKKFVPNPFEDLQTRIRKNIHSLSPLPKEVLNTVSLRSAPPYIHADYSFSTFSLGQYLRREPVLVAKKIVQTLLISSQFITKVDALGPYVNIELAKEPYIKKATEYILKKKNKFGESVDDTTSTVLIDYFMSDTISTFDESRRALLGAVIGRCCALSGRKVVHDYYVANRCIGKSGKRDNRVRSLKKVYSVAGTTMNHYTTEEEFAEATTKVMSTAFRNGAAEVVGDTRAVITVANSTAAPSVLRRQDGSITSLVRHLAYIKSLAKHKPTYLIFLCPREDMDMLDTTLVLAKQMKLLSLHTKLSMLPVPTGDGVSSSRSSRAVKYSMLRTPFHKQLQCDSGDLMQYHHINKVLKKLKQNRGTRLLNTEDRFHVVKFLLNFPSTVSKVVTNHDPSVICLYLEQLSQLSETLHVSRDPRLARATGAVLQNGLNLLLS